ncbi:hypothetical protein Glove_340g12 [Diversispora epigaea]|uniref:Ribosomal protein n=1 Tax=Diversispora epigaea TaxID=1348612 RepID=A0A397HHH6_9GLOM|nr:hypothetical protein Glove_340g12 [Diversispora epigaea]
MSSVSSISHFTRRILISQFINFYTRTNLINAVNTINKTNTIKANNELTFPEYFKVVELSQIRGYASKKKKKRAPFVPANALPFLDAVSVIKAMEVGWPNHTYEVHVKLGFEKGVQNVRGSVSFPKSMSQTAHFLVFTRGAKVQEALDAGATVVGGEEIVAEIQQGTFKFGEVDRCLATPDMLPAVSKIARILGPKQLMPTLKKGTVTDDIKGAIREMAGKFEFKNDKAGIIHAGIGKLSWTVSELRENIRVLLNEINEQGKAHLSKSKSKPKSIINEVCLNATRAPGIYILDYKDIMSGEKLKFMELNYQDLSLYKLDDLDQNNMNNINIDKSMGIN